MSEKKVTKNIKNFLYVMPEETAVKQLSEALPAIPDEDKEIWADMNLMEITLTNGDMIIEDISEGMNNEEDQALLQSLSMKQVFACDYDAADYKEVQQIMKTLTDAFGGILASDTEDFKPYLAVKEL